MTRYYKEKNRKHRIVVIDWNGRGRFKIIRSDPNWPINEENENIWFDIDDHEGGREGLMNCLHKEYELMTKGEVFLELL